MIPAPNRHASPNFNDLTTNYDYDDLEEMASNSLLNHSLTLPSINLSAASFENDLDSRSLTSMSGMSQELNLSQPPPLAAAAALKHGSAVSIQSQFSYATNNAYGLGGGGDDGGGTGGNYLARGAGSSQASRASESRRREKNEVFNKNRVGGGGGEEKDQAAAGLERAPPG